MMSKCKYCGKGLEFPSWTACDDCIVEHNRRKARERYIRSKKKNMITKQEYNSLMLLVIVIGIAIITLTTIILIKMESEAPYYLPGETLDPNCGPEDPQCTVRL